jgi:hypothetical protein
LGVEAGEASPERLAVGDQPVDTDVSPNASFQGMVAAGRCVRAAVKAWPSVVSAASSIRKLAAMLPRLLQAAGLVRNGQ